VARIEIETPEVTDHRWVYGEQYLIKLNGTAHGGRAAALAAALAFAGLFTYAVVMTTPQATANELRRAFGVSGSEFGVLFRTLMLGFLFAAVVGGRISDAFGKLRVMAVGCALMAAGMCLVAFAGKSQLVLLAAALAGLGGGLSEVVASAMISDIFRGPRSTAMMNWSQLAFCFGATVGPLAIAKLIGVGSNWRIGFVVAAGISLICCAFAVVVAVLDRVGYHATGDQDGGWREVVSDPLVWLLSLGLMLYVGAEIGQSSWLAVYFQGDLGAGSVLAAASVAVFWGGVGLGRVAGSQVSRYCSDSKLVAWFSGLAALSQAVLLLVHSPAMAIVATLMLGFCLGPTWPTIVSYAGAAHPGRSGTVIGIVAAAGCLGGAIFPSVIGWAADAAGIRLALWVCFVALIMNVLLFTLSPLKRQHGAVGKPAEGS
jgi:fucose permease